MKGTFELAASLCFQPGVDDYRDGGRLFMGRGGHDEESLAIGAKVINWEERTLCAL